MEGCNISIKPESGSYVVEREIFLRELGGFLQNFGNQLGIVFGSDYINGSKAIEVREQEGLSQNELANELGISQTLVAHHEGNGAAGRAGTNFRKHLTWLIEHGYNEFE